jgi:hypothetical protein
VCLSPDGEYIFWYSVLGNAGTLYRNYLRGKANGKQKKYEERSNANFPIDMSAIKWHYILVLCITAYKPHKIERSDYMEQLTEMLKGVLEGCVLEIISRGQTYGYEITRRLNALGFADVVDGTTYTILIRLEKNKLVEVERKQSDKGPPRNFFTLNEAGRE